MTTTPDLSSLRIQRDDDSRPSRSGRGGTVVWVLIVLALVALAAWVMIARPGQSLAVHAASVSATGGGSASSAGISANGYVVARTQASVSAKILGRLSSLRVHEGSFLRAGRDHRHHRDADVQAQLAAARAAEAQVAVQITQAKRDLQRAEQLRADKLNSEADLEDAQTRVDAAGGAARERQGADRRSPRPISRTRACARRSTARCCARTPRWARSWPRPRRAAGSRAPRSSPWRT